PRTRRPRLASQKPNGSLPATRLPTIFWRLWMTRACGYALSDQETVSGLRVLSAPVFDSDCIPIAGLSVATPAIRMPLKEFEETAKGPVKTAAKALSRAMQAAGRFAIEAS